MRLYFVEIVGVCDFANDEVCEPKPKLFASNIVWYCNGLYEASPLKVDLDAGAEKQPNFMRAWDNIITVGRCPGSSCKVIDGVGLDEQCCLSVNGVNGHGSNEVCTFGLLPNGNDDKFSKVKVGGCTNKFGNGTKRWGEVLHNTSDIGVGDDLKLFVVKGRPSCFRDRLGNEKVGSNFNESGEFVYMCGSKLWNGGENDEGGFGVEPVLGKECLK